MRENDTPASSQVRRVEQCRRARYTGYMHAQVLDADRIAVSMHVAIGDIIRQHHAEFELGQGIGGERDPTEPSLVLDLALKPSSICLIDTLDSAPMLFPLSV
ncbi:MAG: hypothetical protein EOS76_23330 [Mesorhizobium sp.]|uniref:hypothetical protein n=1 Tax=unclassified Mesorhizobium TaxID=325217 RepID=UPI000FCA85D4|nr:MULTISPECIES: hypothetical protein [unclassified Mesorhizobium]RUW64521.1 hypothetical protein EOA31_35670 [Mesorhizobium sp. M4B.F.Ca.ET.049.02.1.2]RWE15242.1 MAG: hypothetical protein EOS76_23330 [Mesorhizobium sp.]